MDPVRPARDQLPSVRSIDGLWGIWGIQFGNGLLSQETNALYAAAGPGDEEHGTYSVIHAH